MPPKTSSFKRLRSTRSDRGVQGVAEDLDEIGDVIGEVIGEEFGDDVIGGEAEEGQLTKEASEKLRSEYDEIAKRYDAATDSYKQAAKVYADSAETSRQTRRKLDETIAVNKSAESSWFLVSVLALLGAAVVAARR